MTGFDCVSTLVCTAGLLVACGATSNDDALRSDGGTSRGGAQNGTAGTSGVADEVEVDAEQRAACEAMAEARCSELATCAPVVFAARYPDHATCVGVDARRCVGSFSASGPSAAALGECATEVSARSCEEWRTAQRQFPIEDSGSCALTGEFEAGERCDEHWQCASGACGNGSCQDLAEEGESCSGFLTCRQGLGCVSDPETVEALCQPPLEAGAECQNFGHACAYPLACIDGTCSEPQIGDSCEWINRDCGEAWGTSYCYQPIGEAGTCVESLVLVGAGETCMGGSLCDASSYCSLSDGSRWGTCVDRPGVGESCEQLPNVLRPECVVGAECQDDVCVWLL